MTKFIDNNAPQTDKTEVTKQINTYMEISSVDQHSPKSWDNVELLVRSYTSQCEDLIYAWDDAHGRLNGALYLGHWNGGKL